MLGSNLSYLLPLDVFNVTITELTIFYPAEWGSSDSSVLSSATSPSQTSLVSLILKFKAMKC